MTSLDIYEETRRHLPGWRVSSDLGEGRACVERFNPTSRIMEWMDVQFTGDGYFKSHLDDLAYVVNSETGIRWRPE